MNQKLESSDSDSSERSQDKQQMIETLKAPIIQLGKSIVGVEIIENYDQGAGPIDVLWTFKPGSEALPDMIGICLYPNNDNSSNKRRRLF
jgi:hypothetical protein